MDLEKKKIAEEQIHSMSSLFSLLSNPTRIKIIWLLKNKKSLSVHDIQKKVEASQSNVSQHLSLLRLHKLIVEERRGKEVYYSLTESRRISKILSSALTLATYQIAHSSEVLSAQTELISYWL